jgi:UDP-N-acetylglucosamine 1-carboxyvinyltransferase
MSSSYHIVGGKQLKGTVEIAGAKNAASKMMIASLLIDESVVLYNMPKQQETAITEEILKTVGASLSWNDHVLTIRASEIKGAEVTSQSRKNRISVLAIAPLLHRTGQAFVPIVGGDKIGPRPVNWHVEILTRMGAKIEQTNDGYRAEAPNGLVGLVLDLPYPSVGSTESAIFSAVLAKGRTVINNAAIEPEIIELIKMLQKMGAIIELGVNRRIEIYGVEKLHGCEIKVMPDPLETVSYACLALGTQGRIFIKGAVHEHLIPFLNTVRRMGGEYKVTDGGVEFFSEKPLCGVKIETDTWPGFRTDWQQPFTVVLTQAKGTSVVHETVWEERFGFTETLTQMGADITLFASCLGEINCRFKNSNYKHSAVINGPTPLKAASIVVPDIRAGLALVLAALVAEGESVLTGIEHLDRGYERLEEKLRGLGADIRRVENV